MFSEKNEVAEKKEVSTLAYTVSAVLAFLAGVTNGLLGAGGGIVLIFMLSRLLRGQAEATKTAFAVSCIAVFFYSGVSASVYAVRGALSFEASAPYLVPALLGGVVGALILQRIRPLLLKRLFALLLVYGGIRMML